MIETASAASTALRLLALGPNPALQKVLSFDSPLQLGGVNRAGTASSYVGGKGQGVALALHRWAPGSSGIAQFLGGDTGSYVEESLRQSGVAQITQPVAAPTRICTTLLDSGGRSSELIEPSGAVTSVELDGLVAKLSTALAGGGGYSGIAFCGTTPPGASTLYAEVAARATADTLIMVDASKPADVSTLLESGRVDVVKCNLDEIKALTSTASADDAASRLLRGPLAPLCRPGALLALTDGADAARLYEATGSAWRLRVPSIAVKNAIGAGDVCTAIFLAELAAARSRGCGAVDGESAADAFAWGLAAACARCTHETPSEFTREEAAAMREKICVEKMEWLP